MRGISFIFMGASTESQIVWCVGVLIDKVKVIRLLFFEKSLAV
jgi:hypothetical protein